MTSRLDRLFVLLESGTSGVTRRAAARQLGEVQRAHPHELQRLLARLAAHLRSPAWETRRAASQAVEAILANVPEWNPIPVPDKIEEECGGDSGEATCEHERESGQLRCATFDLARVLEHGAHLMGSEGNEYDHDEQASSATPDMKDKIARQRQQLNARLGLDMASKLGMDLSDVYTNEDLMCAASPATPTTNEPARRPVPELILSTAPAHGSLSSRERNRAKRMARQALLCKQRSRDASADEEGAAPAPRTPRTPRTPTAPDEPDGKRPRLDATDDVFFPEECCIGGDGAWSAACARWPLEGWACAVSGALFVAAWEARHGAASALRELLRARVAGGAGKRRGQTRRQMENAHQDWLEDMALRLLCVLALDRFGDFVSDQVVAPVRETCAQALGVALSRLEAARVHGVAALLARLARQPQWEARHGALLGFKYLIASREELACSTGAFSQLMAGLSDGVEDVGAVAAGALAPAAAALLRARPGALRPVLARLWELLREQDDLAAACNSYMALLAALLSHPRAAAQLHPIDLSDVLPRLWPYLDHSTSSVRKATLQTLRTLTRPLSLSCKSSGEDEASNGACSEDIKCNAEESNGVTDEITMKTEEKNNGQKEEINIKEEEKNGVKEDNQMHIEENDCEQKEINIKHVENNIKTEQVNVKKEETDTKEEDKNSGDEYMQWTPELLAEAMRFIYQRVLFEHVHEIQEIAEQVWDNLLRYSRLQTLLVAACPLLSTWLCLAMQPPRQPVDPQLLLQPPPLKERRQRGGTQAEAGVGGVAAEVARPPQKWFVGGGESTPPALRERNVTRARCLAAAMLGQLSCYIVLPAPDVEYKTEDESPINCYAKVLVVYLRSGGALQRLVAALVLSAWAQRSSPPRASLSPSPAPPPPPALLTDALHAALTHTIYYDEVAHSCTRILQEARDLTAMMRHYQLPVEGEEFSNIIRLSQVTTLTTLMQPMIANMRQKRVAPQLEERRKNLQSAATQCLADHNSYNVSVLGALAGAGVWLGALPERLNPLVKPLMESVRREPSPELQRAAADALPALLARCRERAVSPAAKVLSNLKGYLRCDPEHTPRAALDAAEEPADSGSNESGAETGRRAPHDTHNLDRHRGILTLWEQQRAAERGSGSARRVSAAGGRPLGRPPAPPPAPPTPIDAADLSIDALFPQEDDAQKLLRIQRRGATLAFTSLAKYFGDELPQQLPKLWEFITEPFSPHITDKDLESQGCAETDELISCMQVLEAVCGSVSAALRRELAARAGALARLTRHHHTAARHMAARCLAALAAHEPARLMQLYIDEVVPALGAAGEERVRCGAAEALARAVDALQLRVVPYIVLLVVPLLGRMSDHCEPVRLMSTRCFASLIQLMPLDGAVPEPAGVSPELRARRAHDRRFLERLFNPKCIEDYKTPVPVAAELRSYQQAGVNWLRFLQQYKLHGVLCDDMGLGKTLQSIVVVVGAHWERAQRYAATRAPEHAALPSLVVCPPTLTGHWVYEVKKFIPREYLNPLQYMGPPSEREKLRAQVKRHDLIVASYDIVRKDIDFFSGIRWHYCILDEGHVIKNGKTKAFKAIKMLVANHRLILSGTPIQNNVLELWSLFDFLMPGLLGTERQFTARYSRAILAARDPRATPHHQQAGAKAMEALHRQVLPFLLRRVKEDVLQELPPKITQDYYCELSPLQRRLYEDFSRAHLPEALAPAAAAQSPAATAAAGAKSHVFQALRYLQNVCNHPKLVLTEEHPEGARVRRELAAQQSSLHDIQHSAKLPALKQLLQDCGIGVSAGGGGGGAAGGSGGGGGGAAEAVGAAVVSQHRALIFCQLKAMLDIVERDLLRAHLPGVSYLRLDGSVAPGARHALVHTFNSDPSIDVLLLTTKVGGLGLNLTGADTVIFVEHDWNPMRDLQAMDRAHRIGQRRVVNVYRLITRNTLEEKIMGLQKFKVQTANTVISNENAALETMGTEQLLDLFHLASDSPAAGAARSGAAAALDSLPELWDDKQYEEEYDMSCFIQSLNKE